MKLPDEEEKKHTFTNIICPAFAVMALVYALYMASIGGIWERIFG